MGVLFGRMRAVGSRYLAMQPVGVVLEACEEPDNVKAWSQMKGVIDMRVFGRSVAWVQVA